MRPKAFQAFYKKLETIKSHYNRYGFFSTVHVVTFQPLEKVKLLRVGYCHSLSIDGVSTKVYPEALGIEVRELTRPEIRALANRAEDWFFKTAVETSLERGDVCFGAILDGEVICSAWGTTAPLLQFGLLLVPPEDGFFEYRLFTKPEYRGQRIQVAVRSLMLQHFKERGFHWYFNTMYWTNTSSIAGARRIGFHRVATIVQIGPDSWNLSRILFQDKSPLVVVRKGSPLGSRAANPAPTRKEEDS